MMESESDPEEETNSGEAGPSLLGQTHFSAPKFSASITPSESSIGLSNSFNP